MEKIKKQNKFSYPSKSYRFSRNAIDAFASLKSKIGKSYNLLILDLIYSF